MSFRAFGALNGMLPQPSNMTVAYMRSPDRYPFLQYAQLVPAPDLVFMYNEVDPDTQVRLVGLNENDWGYDDYSPTGKGFQPRIRAAEARIERRAFPYTLGNETIRVWQQRGGVNVRQLFDRARANHAQLHRASRVVNALAGTSWGSNTGTFAAMSGVTGAKITDSSAEELLPSGLPNPNFQILKKAFQAVKRRIHLATNGAVTGEEHICVMPPLVAEAFSRSGEIVKAFEKSQFAKEVTTETPIVSDWSLPPSYGGFKLVVEDTPRVFIVEKADGTVADVALPAERDYILNTDTIYFLARPGGLQSDGLGQNYSTIQVWTYRGDARVEAFTEPKHDLVEARVVTEDRVLVPAKASGFALTDCL